MIYKGKDNVSRHTLFIKIHLPLLEITVYVQKYTENIVSVTKNESRKTVTLDYPVLDGFLSFPTKNIL